MKRTDKERLDYIFDIAIERDEFAWTRLRSGLLSDDSQTCRQAIDAAMRQEKRP
jgi:hypothetical protein